MGATNAVGQAPLFSIETLTILGIQLVVVFHLAATLCENGGTPYVVKSKTLLHLLQFPI
jgi:hypothetical protein